MVTKLPCELVSGSLALDFVNSQERKTGKPWIEKLGTYADLLAWGEASASLSRTRARALARLARARPADAATVLEGARVWREAAYRVFTALVCDETPPPADLELLNAGVASALAHARLRWSSGALAWDWDPDPGALDAPLWPVARAAAELLTSPELALVRRCASETCLWLFLDTTKNHQRRWCDMRVCGNRAKVRAHRRRVRAAGSQ